MTNAPAEPKGPIFLNRDHIVLLAVQEARLILTLTVGTRVVISGSSKTLKWLTDELVNAVGSNYVAIPDSAQISWEPGPRPEGSRFVDHGLEFITITK